jgi:hypothetical protein
MKQFSKELGKVSITPKGDWDSSIANEKLDIVYDRRNNQAYIAKQDVPIGVDIDNREYWQPLNVSGYADNNFINLTAENENGTITAYESLEEAVATIFPINRRVGATLSFYNLNSDRLDRQAEFELWQFNSTDLANWENKDYWNNIYYNWNVFAGWYIDADALNNHVEIPNVGQYAYVGSNLNDALLYQCRTNGTWTNTGIKVRNYISVVVSGNITIGENGNWFSDGEDTGIPATPAVDEQIDNIITKHKSLSRTVQGIAATGGASTATNVTYNNDSSGLSAENAQDAINELAAKNKTQDATIDTKAEKSEVATELDKKFNKENIAQELGDSKNKVISQFALPFREIESPEFIKAIVDAKDHFLFGIQLDGSIEWGKGIPAPIRTKLQEIINQCQKDKTDILEAINGAKEELAASITVLQEGKVDKEEGKSLIDSYVADAHSTLEDPEGRTEITLDVDDKVMSYRDSYGKKHEHDMEVTNLDVSNLNLQGNSVNNIQDALKANGFDVKTPIDWSESSFIQISEPRLAIINITNIDSMPTTKTQNKKAFLEFWDMHGNYFKKHAILNAQGNSSMAFDKKNVAIDLCNDEWIGDDTPKVRIGNWVPQDSFHMKAYYTDFFRGVGAVSYKLYDQIVRTRGNMYDRPWKKALLDMSKIGTTTKSLGNPHVGDYELLTDTGARCFPDGFPVAVYLNGEFYGIFSFQLKKHRDNYHMDKSTAEHIHLDGIIDYNILWNGTIVWGAYNNGFEVRNPKNLYAIGGNKYDADIKQEEIAGESEVNTWIAAGQLPDGTSISSKIKKNLQMTAKVKKYIQDFANTINIIKTAASTYEASSKTEEDLKAFKSVFEKYYDVENLIDYIITIDILRDIDGLKKNWQWFTYNGIKWWVGLYDCDCVFGGMHLGNMLYPPINSHLGNDPQLPTGFILKYYNDVLEKRYAQLADAGIISTDNIFSLLQDWCMRIGTDFFKEEYKKWADSPCIADSVVRSEYWEAVLDGSGNPQTDTSETFDSAHAYNVGDVVSFGLNAQMGYFKYKCIKATSALSANTPHIVSAYSPISEFKHCDNIYRVQKWIEQNTTNMDKVYNYTRNNQ